jgi:site-specific recombinase XerD
MLIVKRGAGMIRGVAGKTRPDPAVLQAAVAAWLDNYDSPHTRAAYSADLAHFRHWSRSEQVDPLALDEDDLRRYRAACEAGGAAPATVARRLSAIASFGSFALARGTAGVQPRVERPTLPAASTTQSLSEGDAAALLAAADRMNPRAALLIRLLMLDGLKIGEAVRADATDISGRPPGMTLTLRAAAPRVIHLHPDTADLVAEYLGRRRRGPLLFSEHRARVTERLTRFGVDYIVKQAVESAGIGGAVSANTLRRRFVMAAHERGEDLEGIRQSAGHADSRTTRRYLDTVDGEPRDRALHPDA